MTPKDLPEPINYGSRGYEQLWRPLFTKDQVLAIQREAYELGARSTAAQPVESTGPWLDDEGRAMIANSHHYTAANIKAIVDELNCLSDPDRTPLSDIENKDLRTWFGVLARIITGLAHEVPTAPAASGDSTPPSEPVTDGMVEAFISFAEKATHLHHPDVPYFGTANGDSEVQWHSRVVRAALTAALNARVQGDPSGAPRAEPEAAGQGRWQPIETAPKDGTTIIVGRDMGDFGFIRGYARFEGAPGSFLSGWISNGFSEIISNLGLAHPTLWQPLPEPPQAASGSRGDRHGS